MHPSSAEYTVATTFLDWLTALPWHTASVDTLDIKHARRILDDDHYGLEKPKRRIIEYLAVRKLKPDSKGRSCASLGRRARARPRSASPSRAPSAASSTACRSAAYATKPKSAATAAPTWARCRAG